MDLEPVVFAISGDSKVRRAQALRLKLLGCDARVFISLDEFQKNSSPRDPGCILFHVAHAEIDTDWLSTLGAYEDHWPVIGIAAAAEVETAVRAMKGGAFDFVLESCSNERLQAAVEDALRWDAAKRKHITHVQSIRRRLKQLTQPYRDVLELLLKGKSNREIAAELGMSVRSIEVRRAKVMRTMKTRTLAALVRKTLLAYGDGPSRNAERAGELSPIAPLK